MPFISKKLKSEEIEFGNKKTLILDIKKTAEITKELETEGLTGKSLSLIEIRKIKETFGNLESFKDILIKDDKKWLTTLLQIKNIEEFYDIVWERTILELMFLSQYYLSLISNPQSFEIVLKSGDEFEFWFKNNVKYNMLEKIKNFYLKLTRIYANKISIDIYEVDVEAKSKEVINEIKNNHLIQIKEFLSNKWDEAMNNYKVWIKKTQQKRKSILFD